MKHTPGPWILDSRFPDSNGYKIRGGQLAFSNSPRLIAIVKNQGSAPAQESPLADASLIAAAPELLEALKCLLDSLGALSSPHELDGWLSKSEQDQIWSAIAKAEGTPPC